MNRKRLLITEDDRRHILGLYGVLTEAIDPNSGGTVTINNYYPNGWYTLENKDTKSGKIIKDQLNEALAQVTEFVKKHPDSIVSIKFISQESAIPNKDNEGKEGGDFLPVKGLSDLRKKYLEPYIKSYFDSLKTQGVIGQTVEVPPLEYIPKDFVTPWVGTPFCPASATIQQQRSECINKYRQGVAAKNPEIVGYKAKYDTEQSSAIEITVKLKTSTTTQTTKPVTNFEACAKGFKVRVYVPKHNCQNAEFFVFANSTILYNSQGGLTANLNNSYTSRGIPRSSSPPTFYPEALNPGYGFLKNGDGTLGSYKFGSKQRFDESAPKNTGDNGNGRSDSFTVTGEQAKKMLVEGSGKINLWMIGTSDTTHDDINFVSITDEDQSEPFYNKQPNFNQGKLLTISFDTTCKRTVIDNNDKTVPDVTGWVDKLRQEKIAVMSEVDNMGITTGNKKTEAKRKLITDSKAVLQERVEGLVSKMFALLTSIFDDVSKTPTPNYVDNGVAEKIKSDYNEFYSGLTATGTPKEPLIVLSQDESGDFTNKTLRDDPLYGDIRNRMNQFYEGFNAIYKNKEGEITPNGVRRSDGSLNVTTLLSRIKGLKQWEFRR